MKFRNSKSKDSGTSTNWELKRIASVSGKEKMRSLSVEAAHKMAENSIFNMSWFSNSWERNQYELKIDNTSSKILCTSLVIAVG